MYSYFTEILLLTKSDYPDELECWLNWYLNILKFDHIVILDNESPINIQDIISKFPQNKIEYHYILGWPNQHALYTEYLKKSKAEWVIPLDDDEYLYIGEKHNHNIKDLINYLYTSYRKNKYYFLWLNMFSPNYNKYRTGLFINTHTSYSYLACRRIYSSWPEDNGWGKCIINTKLEYEYQTNSNVGHIPVCLNGDNTTVLYDGTETESAYISSNDFQQDCFIAHYQYKSDFDWERKCLRQVVHIPNRTNKSRKHIYRKLYEYKSMFKSCFLLKEMLNTYLTK